MDRSKRPLQHLPLPLLVLSVCCFILVSGREAAGTRCIESEQRALLQFKNGFVDDYGVFSSWQSSQDCCLWRGVGCSNTTDHVIMLDLHGHWSDDLHTTIGFSGEINSSLLELQHLTHLDLSYNSFTHIPEFIGSLGKLSYLNLSAINLEATVKVPPQLGNLSRLQTLDLSGFSFILKNTEWLSKLSSLKYLSLDSADLSESNNLLQNLIGGLPSLFELHLHDCLLSKASANWLLPITNFSMSLSVLDISNNDLPSSSIYPWLFNFSGSLTNIDLSYNELLGTIPKSFGAFKSLENIDLSSTGLEGSIPKSFGNFSNLRLLHLTGNKLKEDLPSFFRHLGPAEKSLQVLKLSSNKLSGSLPDFTRFTDLRELYLINNELTGPFPEKFEQISHLLILDLADNQMSGLLPDLSALSSLKELYFERNHIEGSLAERLMPLSELQFLGASSNLLNGTISETHLTNLSHLVYLDLSHNSLVIEFDSDWYPPFSLDTISLSSCKLGPSFPSWLRTQRNFSIIDISIAQINDSVPNWFWEQLTPSLRYLNISSNQIHGSVPDLISGDLPSIDLSSNNFSGPIPLFASETQALVLYNNTFSGSVSFLWNLTNIVKLDLSYNQLSGELPDFWMNFTRLLFLNLEYNKFSGRIPASMGSLSYLFMWSMRSNSLTGELPSSLKNCDKLEFLDLGENNLSGYIPAWVGESLLELRVISLTSNRFYGTLPTSICSLSKMQILDISVNNISGTIPTCLSRLNGMTERKTGQAFMEYSIVGLERTRLTLSRDFNRFKALLVWKGRKALYRSTLGLVTSLDLSSNSFDGEIPGEISNLLGLVALNLSRNNLTGQIPEDIGGLRWLDFLDISRNHLVGGIPTSLSQVSNLGVLDLSNNNFSGKVPMSTQLQSFNASSYIGNPALCGLPLPNACPGDFVPQIPPATVGTVDNDQDKFITRGFFVSISIGLAIGFWGVCGTLVVNDSWRHAYFEFLSHVKDWIYVVIAVNYARLQGGLDRKW